MYEGISDNHRYRRQGNHDSMGNDPSGLRIGKGQRGRALPEVLEFTFARLVIRTGVVKSDPQGIAETSLALTEKGYCFLEATQITKDAEVSFVWFFYGKDGMRKIHLPVKMGPRGRTWAFKNLRGSQGKWKIDIREASGNLLKEVPFKVE